MQSSHALQRLFEARALDGQIRDVVRRKNEANAQLAFLLLEMKEKGLYVSLGYESIDAYAWAAAASGSSRTRQLVATARRLEKLPAMREAFLAGEIDWTKARTATKAAERDGNEAQWLELSGSLNSRELEREAASRDEDGPKLEKVVVTLELTPEQRAILEDAIIAVRKSCDEGLTRAESIFRIIERSISGGADGGQAVHRILVHVCADCDGATRQTADGPVAVSAGSVAKAGCDAEVLDVRNGPARISRTMPAKIANFIDARDGGRCRFPGCGNTAFIERHHEGGWRLVGQDPDACMLLCEAHHRARHREEIVVSGRHPDFVFTLADGSVITERPSVRVTRERRVEGGTRERARPSALDDSMRALVRLGLKKRDARAKVAAAAQDLGDDASAEALIRLALRPPESVLGS